MKLTCNSCKYVLYDNHNENVIRINQNKYHMVTITSVNFVMLLGFRYAATELCGLFSLRHFTHETYAHYAKCIMKEAVANANEILERSRAAVLL